MWVLAGQTRLHCVCARRNRHPSCVVRQAQQKSPAESSKLEHTRSSLSRCASWSSPCPCRCCAVPPRLLPEASAPAWSRREGGGVAAAAAGGGCRRRRRRPLTGRVWRRAAVHAVAGTPCRSPWPPPWRPCALCCRPCGCGRLSQLHRGCRLLRCCLRAGLCRGARRSTAMAGFSRPLALMAPLLCVPPPQLVPDNGTTRSPVNAISGRPHAVTAAAAGGRAAPRS